MHLPIITWDRKDANAHAENMDLYPETKDRANLKEVFTKVS